jgi:hypothetical protein
MRPALRVVVAGIVYDESLEFGGDHRAHGGAAPRRENLGLPDDVLIELDRQVPSSHETSPELCSTVCHVHPQRTLGMTAPERGVWRHGRASDGWGGEDSVSVQSGSIRGVAATIATAGVLLYAWWATGLRPFTGGANVAVVGAGVVAMVIGRAAPVTTTPSSPPVGARAAGWMGLFAELVAYFQHPRYEHPTVSSLVNSALDSHIARWVAFAAWLVAAAGLARR